MRPGLTDTPLATLREALDRAMDFKPPQFDVEFISMDREADKLRTWLGARGSGKPPQDASRAALRDFVRNRDLPTLRHASLASFGCTDPFDDRRYGLIADGELFPVFLDRVDDYRETRQALRYCYRGLLHSYFQYDVERGPKSARENWDRLRTYLGTRAHLIVTSGFLPPWVETLQRNPEVLGPDPGSFYGAEIFRGRPERFEEVRAELAIADASWLVWRVVVGQIEAATHGSDAEFRAAILGLLELLNRHLLAKNFGLAKLLTRYHACASPTLHERLRDYAVDAWGNPWLARNEAKWSVVSPEARKMVAEWLKLALMLKFFGLLADDGLNDTRRLKFWEAYHQSIHAMYFALGDTASRHAGSDFREVRNQMEGLRLTLTHSTAKNNAFIMCIGEHVIVEFGEKGNACFIFHKDRLPFVLAGEVAGNSFALKHSGYVERLLHTDSGMSAWEDKFRTALSTIVGVQAPSPAPGVTVIRDGLPGGVGPTGRPATPTPMNAQPHMPGITQPGSRLYRSPGTTFTLEEVRKFCEARRFQWAVFGPRAATFGFTQNRRERMRPPNWPLGDST